METSNNKRIFSGNVTCCGKNKRYSNRSHLPQRFKCSSLLACKTPRVQLSICFPSSLSRIHLIRVLPTAFKTFCSNKLGILTGRSWHFSDMSSDTSARWANESTSHDANKANGMLTSHAKRIFSDNGTCFGTNKCCSNWSHLSGCLKCSSLLACKAPRAQLSICFPTSLSHIHLTASLLCPANSFQDILFEKTGNSFWKQVAFLQRIK